MRCGENIKFGGVYVVKTTYIEINFLPCVFDHLGFLYLGILIISLINLDDQIIVRPL